MDPESDQIGPSKNHELFCNPQDPVDTTVMLKNTEHMDQLHYASTQKDINGQQVTRHFPNYFILNNITTAHKQKAVLQSMLKQKTDPQIMIDQFCELARVCYPNDLDDIERLKHDFLGKSVPATGIIWWYTDKTFFYQLLNRLLRGGKDSTELYYGQHFTKLLAKAITQVYRKQKAQKRQQVSETFKCYRGATFSQNQIDELQKNVGKHIETLGFMSTSTNESIPNQFIGNAFVEIEVASDAPKDDELDLGYAYLSKEYSNSPRQQQVLFNVLSSFQVKSVELDGNFWHIKLEYGVTYQMVHNYKQNKLKKGTAEEQLILAIISHQNQFKGYNFQQYCLYFSQNAVDEYIWLKKTKISLLKSIPRLQQIGQYEQFNLYHKLTTNEEFKGKQQKYVKQIEPKYLSSINSQNINQSTITLWQNMQNIKNSIINNFSNKNYESVQQLAKKWRQLKQQLLKDIQFQQAATQYSRAIEIVQQQETQVSVFEAIANISLLDKKGDIQKLKQQIQAAQQLQQRLLTKYDRYHYLYMALRHCCMYYAYNHGLISYELVLEFQQQGLMFVNGFTVDQQNTFQAKLIRMQNQANRHIQQKQWAEAVRLCADFRDNHYKGREHQDEECFQPIINQLNKKNSNFGENGQILEACLSVKHPKDSEYYKKVEKTWIRYKQQRQQQQKKYFYQITTILTLKPSLLLYQLHYARQKVILAFSNDSMVWIAHQCLIVNTFRMLGSYKQANEHFSQLKQRILGGKHPEYYQQLQLHKFERE